MWNYTGHKPKSQHSQGSIMVNLHRVAATSCHLFKCDPLASISQDFVIRERSAPANHIALSLNSKGLKFPRFGPAGSSLFPPSLAFCKEQVNLNTCAVLNQQKRPRGPGYKSLCCGLIRSSITAPLTGSRGGGKRADGRCRSPN